MDGGEWLCVFLHPVKELVCQEKCQENPWTGDEISLPIMDDADIVQKNCESKWETCGNNEGVLNMKSIEYIHRTTVLS